MRNLEYSIAAMVILIIPALPGMAQSNLGTVPAPLPAIESRESTANANAVRVKEQKALALSLLLSLANEARSFSDEKLRARTQARSADALWEIDRELARSIFVRAWEAAELADKERQRNEGGYTTPAHSREEVLRLAARRDRSLAEDFLRKFKEQKEQNGDASKSIRLGPFSISDEVARQRLALARHFLDVNDVERATQFADGVLGFANIETVDFLSALRSKNSTAADQRYLLMLLSAEARLQSDVDTVSILSSYIFTPHIYVTSQGRGVFSSQSTSLTEMNPDPRLTTAFFRTATEILFRQVSASGQPQDTSVAEGRYPVMNHLMALFDLCGPKNVADALRTQLVTLRPLVSDVALQRDDNWRTKWLNPTATTPNPEESLLDQISRAKTSSQRDQLYLKLALMTAEKGDVRARDFADKIEDGDLRKSARSYVNADLAIRAIGKKDIDRALEAAKPGELTSIQRVWVLTQAAKVIFNNDRDKGLATVQDAAAEARRINGNNPDRPQALMAVANALMTTDRTRAWEIGLEAVKAANAAEGFTGEDGILTVSLISKYMTTMRNVPAPDFDIEVLFTGLAKDNYNRALALARDFERDAPKANATIAVARWLINAKAEVEKPQRKESN